MTTPDKFVRETEHYWVLAEEESESRPGKFYEIRTSKRDGKTYCNCPSWIFKARKGDGICKHIANYKRHQPEAPVVVYKFDEFVAVKRGIALMQGGAVKTDVKVRRA